MDLFVFFSCRSFEKRTAEADPDAEPEFGGFENGFGSLGEFVLNRTQTFFKSFEKRAADADAEPDAEPEFGGFGGFSELVFNSTLGEENCWFC